MMTVHALGGPKMIEAARRGLTRGAAVAGLPEPALLAVTILTSHVEADLPGLGIEGPIADRVVALAKLAVAAGALGVVSSPEELVALADALSPTALRVTPGIRGAGEATQDQARTLPPDEAIRRGATHLVVGRPIRDAADPVAAARAIVARIAQAAG
jgi:orotidine-5'-phosphate decarboxylase